MIEVSSQEHTSAIEIGYRNLLTPGVLPPLTIQRYSREITHEAETAGRE